MRGNTVEQAQATRDRAALLVIDVQQALFEQAIPVHRAEAFLSTVNELIGRARLADAPVVYVQHANKSKLRRGSAGWQLHRSLLAPGGDLHIHKVHGSAFEETDLDTELAARQVGTVVVTGLVTHGCVQAACRDALGLGYRVVLPSDGHSHFNRGGASLIDEWNAELAGEGVRVIPAEQVTFDTWFDEEH
jgi:nicotinamidase-related amidase